MIAHVTHPDLVLTSGPASQRRILDDGSAAIRALVTPPTLCPSCWYEDQQSATLTPFPAYASTRQCARHHADALARRHPQLADLNARLRQALAATTTAATLPERAFCPHCYRKAHRVLPDLAFVQNCRQHSDFDPICGVCRGRYDTAKPCSCCGSLGYIFSTLGEQAAFCLEIPFMRFTSGARWLVDLLRRVAHVDAWAADDWEDAYLRMEPLTRPGMPWHRQPFAQAAMRLVVAEGGPAILARLPVLCAACMGERHDLNTPASYRLEPCERHLAEAIAAEAQA
jgi:hypothetical protein